MERLDKRLASTGKWSRKEARELIAIGGARSVANAGELIGWFSPLRDDETTYRETACRIKAYTSQHQGATKQIVDTVFRQ